MKHDIIESGVRLRAEKLRRDLELCRGLSGAAVLAQRLARALETSEQDDPGALVTIALIGGTGAGKSSLFNRLLRTEGASPVSHVERAFTRRCYVAAQPEDLLKLGLQPDEKTVFVRQGIAGLALIDTPDLDSAVPENWEQARRAIEMADIVVYVALPEKRSSFAITEEVQRWAERKRWFFVLNKVDQCQPEDLSGIRTDFAKRVEALGFQTSDSTLFVISATQPDHPYSELERLRTALYSGRTLDEIHGLRRWAALRSLAAAVAEDGAATLHSAQAALAAAETELSQRAKELYIQVLSAPMTRDHLSEIVRARVWRQVPGRVGGLLALPLWGVARLNHLWLGVSLSRLAGGGISLGGILQTAVFAAASYLRGAVPLQAVLAAFGARELAELQRIRVDALRKMEDLGVSPEPDSPRTEESVEKPAQGSAPWWQQALGDGGDPERAGLSSVVLNAVEQSAAVGARRAVGQWHRFFGNLLPLLVMLDIARKVGAAWLADRWLPGDFYWTAFVLFVLSLLPGCFMVGAGVRSRARLRDPSEFVASWAEPSETLPLREAHRHVDGVLRQLGQLRRELGELSSEISSGLAPDKFGAEARK